MVTDRLGVFLWLLTSDMSTKDLRLHWPIAVLVNSKSAYTEDFWNKEQNHACFRVPCLLHRTQLFPIHYTSTRTSNIHQSTQDEEAFDMLSVERVFVCVCM